MIQRIQTVYLALAALISIILLFLSFDGVESIYSDMLLAGPLVGIAVVSAVCIGFFKQRPLQMKLCKINFFLGAYVVAFPLFELIQDGGFSFNLAWICLPLPYLFSFLAYRGIRADERLVRESDRLR